MAHSFRCLVTAGRRGRLTGCRDLASLPVCGGRPTPRRRREDGSYGVKNRRGGTAESRCFAGPRHDRDLESGGRAALRLLAGRGDRSSQPRSPADDAPDADRGFEALIECQATWSGELTQLQKAQVVLTHMTRVTTLGEVTASFAHELNQPLAAIVNNASACLGLLPGEPPDLDEVREALGDIVADAERASAMIERVRALARRSAPSRCSSGSPTSSARSWRWPPRSCSPAT